MLYIWQVFYQMENALVSSVCWKVLCEPITAFIFSKITNSVTSKNRFEHCFGRTTLSPSFLSVACDLNISESPHVKTLGSVLYYNGSAGPTFVWLFPVRVRQTFWTLNNARVHMASRQEEGELFVPCCREWKRGCIVLPIQESFHIFTKHFNSYASAVEFHFQFLYSKCFPVC